MYLTIISSFEFLNEQFLGGVVTKLYDQIINSAGLTEIEASHLLQRLFRISPTLDQKRVVLKKIKELDNDIDLSKLWVEIGCFQFAFHEIEQSYKQGVSSYDLNDMILNLVRNLVQDCKSEEERELYSSIKQFSRHIEDVEVKSEKQFLLLCGKYLLNNPEKLMKSIREIGEFSNRDTYLEGIFNIVLAMGKYQLVLEYIDLFSTFKARLEYFVSVLKSPNCYEEKEILYKYAKNMLDKVTDPKDQLLGYCRLLSSFDMPDYQSELQLIKDKFTKYFLVNDFKKEKFSWNPLLLPSDLRQIAIELSRIGLFNEAFLVSKYIDDGWCEQSRTICGICEELICQKNFSRAEEWIVSIKDERWQEIGKKALAVGYAVDGQKGKADQLLKQIQSWDVNDSTYEELGIFYFENGETDLAIDCFSQIKHQEYLSSALVAVTKNTDSQKIDHKILDQFLLLFTMRKLQNEIKEFHSICQNRLLKNQNPDSLMANIASELVGRVKTSFTMLSLSDSLTGLELEEVVLRKFNDYLSMDKVYEDQSIQQVTALCWLLISLCKLEESDQLLGRIEPLPKRLAVFEGAFQMMVSENSEISITYLTKSLNLLRLFPLKIYMDFLQRNLILLEIIGGKNLLSQLLYWSDRNQFVSS